MKVGLVQINNSFSGQNYLPYSIGLLQAYVEKHAPNKHEFLPMVYKRAPIDSIVQSLISADLVGFSIYVWNERISLEIARRLKAIKPEIITVFGGPQVPDNPWSFLESNPQVNQVVHNEGERAFLDIVEGRCVIGAAIRKDRLTNIDEIPSPFLEGTFDALMAANPDEKWIGLWETNRGCPFRCTFCCVVGTLVSTIVGPKEIQNVIPGEKVFGWDEGKQAGVWNTVVDVAGRGKRRALKIVSLHGEVEATADHRFLTRRGWVEACHLVAGDEVLFNVREGLSPQQKDERILFQRLLDEVLPQGRPDSEGAQGRKVRGSLRGNFRPDAEEQSDEETRRSEAAISDNQGGNRIWNGDSIRVYAEGDSQDQGGRAEEDARARQPDEEQSDDDVRLIAGEALSQRLREEGYGVSGDPQFALPIHRRRDVLDRAMQVGEESEPRLCLPAASASDPGAWQVLASETAGGNRRLREQGLENVHYLGQRGQTRPRDGREDSQFCWAAVTSIEDGGEREVYDLIGAHPHPNFFANGFLAHNCDWGSATAAKVTEFGMDRLASEVTWFARNKIEYVFCCDANFGIKKRDIHIAQYVADCKKINGYPKALSVQNTKNATERAYETQRILSDAGLNKGVALSMQSVDPATLVAVKRDNISLDTYMELQRRFEADKVETYSDLILALPGESYESFANGVDKLISNGQHNRIQFNNLSILPNAEMGNVEYQKRYGMVTVQSEIINIHGERVKLEDDVPEYQQLVIATDAMPLADWRRARVFAWWCALLVFDKLFAFPLHAAHEKGRSYREMIEAFMRDRTGVLANINLIFNHEAYSIQNGGPEYMYSPQYLGIYWPADEFVFMWLIQHGNLDMFYREASAIVQGVETEAKRNQAQLNLPGEDFQKWCREVVWWGNKKGGYLRPLAGHT